MENIINDLLPLSLALITTGVIAGILAGMLGVGGGIVIVPVLFHLFLFMGINPELCMHIAVATSLSCIVLTASSSARSHNKRKSVDIDLVKSWGPGVFFGVILGTTVASITKGPVITIFFAIVCLFVAANLGFGRTSFVIAKELPKSPLKYVFGLIIGGISSMVGIGGGSITVPILNAYNVPIVKAVGTSSAIGVIIAIAGSIGYAISGFNTEGLPFGNLGYVNLIGFALIVPTAWLCAPIGVKIAHNMDPIKLRRIFAVMLVITAIKMFYRVL